jgi:hypothetical protein
MSKPLEPKYVRTDKRPVNPTAPQQPPLKVIPPPSTASLKAALETARQNVERAK